MEKSNEKVFTTEEIAKHNSNESLWLLIDGNVYDVTSFTNEHPGGEEPLLEQAGKDATVPFKDVGHSADAQELMKEYKIGVVEKTCTWKKDAVTSIWKAAQIVLPVSFALAASFIAYKYYSHSHK